MLVLRLKRAKQSFAVELLLKGILLEIGFIEETRTTWGNKKMLQTLFHYSSYSRKYI